MQTEEVRKYYEFDENEELSLENVAIKRRWILKGETPDIKRTSQIVLSTFREGKIGKFTLDRAEEYSLV